MLQKANNKISKTLNFLHKTDNKLESLNEDIYLMNCFVMYIYDYDLMYYPTEESLKLEVDNFNIDDLAEGDFVEVRKEPCKDRKTAISLYHNKKKIGYVFKIYDEILTNLINAGFEIYGKIDSISGGLDNEIFCDLFLKE